MVRGWRARPLGPLAVSLVAVLLLAGAVVYLVTRSSDPREVSPDVLPTVPTAQQAAVYVDCSKPNAVAYFSDNPCQTFVLLESKHFPSASEFLAAESHHMMVSGWRHSVPQLVDYDGIAFGMASAEDSWVAPANQACAYVATGQTGVAAETNEIFPRDPYDVPQGVYDFYRKAKAANSSETLWVRLRPLNTDGHCAG
jgi:hypothetical protein